MTELLLLSNGVIPQEKLLPSLTLVPYEITSCELNLTALNHTADLILLDATCDPIAAKSLCPLLSADIVVVLVDDVCSRLVDHTWGASDVIHVTATAAELDLRLRLLLAPTATSQLQVCDVLIDENAYKASVAGRPLDLTYTEFELLRFLVSHPERVHSRDHLLTEVWGYDYFGGSRTVDVHIRRLRAKLGPEHDALIETVRNVGYRFAPR
ncbi:MAG: winged helix-turn-helix domain-containing protein [Propionibacteriaceae bacterium]